MNKSVLLSFAGPLWNARRALAKSREPRSTSRVKLEGEYAVEKVQRVHRILSVVVVALWIGLAFYCYGLGQAFRTAVGCLLPLVCIWFPDAMASYTGVMWGRGTVIDERSHPGFLRWAGWFLLLIVPLALIAICFLNR